MTDKSNSWPDQSEIKVKSKIIYQAEQATDKVKSETLKPNKKYLPCKLKIYFETYLCLFSEMKNNKRLFWHIPGHSSITILRNSIKMSMFVNVLQERFFSMILNLAGLDFGL
jgi:hypothetical protein